ncbi:hypothetical protein MMC06_005230 [Schaereria dolodes]|nr:hypothetical protein [Schaereria dolodes]
MQTTPSSYPNRLAKRYASIDCFEQIPGPHVLLTPDGTDCVKAAMLIVGGDKSEAPIEFSRSTGFILPHRWFYESCTIFADVAHEHDIEIFTLTEIGTIALGIMVPCVGNPKFPGLGGRSLGGRENLIRVILMGTRHGPPSPSMVTRTHRIDIAPTTWPGYELARAS